MKNEESDEYKQKLALMEQNIKITKKMSHIKHKIAVMSGKGGVGKSTIAVNLATAFLKKGYKAGILDSDIHGPNIPRMLGIGDSFLKFEKNQILPIKTDDDMEVISTKFLLPDEDSPIIWRGPKKTGAIRQFLSDVKWGDLDVLIIDNPPGTGDEPLTILQSIPSLDGVIIVTTPQSVSLDDVKKCINMLKHLNISIIGLLENMSGFVCPHCNEEFSIFGQNNGEKIAEKMDIPFLGSLSVDINVSESIDNGIPVLKQNPDSVFSKGFFKIFSKIEDYIKEVEK
ncbi:MAG: ATP-binding protein [Methanobacterium sp. BRmetb2]|jgi:Mrp family chromosome partitioning ATPase|nr:MAG: ATP-binding protein [Methanobacterium sp. BRmetb2]